MRTKTSVSPDLKILAVLAATKEMEQYKLPKETELSYRTILRTLKPLESKDRWQIQLLRKEPSEKGGKEKKIYGITLIGLLRVLKESVMRNVILDDVDYIRRIINAHPELLLTFEKWELFKKAGLESQILTYVAHGVLDFYIKSTLYLMSGVPNLKNLSSSKLRDWIDELILLRPFMYERERGLPLDIKFLQACKRDKKLSEFINQRLALLEQEYKRLSHDRAEWEKL